MPAQVIEVFAVHGDNDNVQGDLGPVEGYCRTLDEAKTAARGRGWYGRDGIISQAHVVVVEDGVMYALASPKPIQFLTPSAAAN